MEKRVYTDEELAEVIYTKSFLEACKKYGDGITDATKFIQICMDLGITPLPGNYIVKTIKG